jgi:hypothetical protein
VFVVSRIFLLLQTLRHGSPKASPKTLPQQRHCKRRQDTGTHDTDNKLPLSDFLSTHCSRRDKAYAYYVTQSFKSMIIMKPPLTFFLSQFGDLSKAKIQLLSIDILVLTCLFNLLKPKESRNHDFLCSIPSLVAA